jgi:divalent metal cation (Fe/Co/Zn/Cd) transporter
MTMRATRITVYAALASNLVVAVVKAVAGLVSGSNVMLAKAAHSLAEREPDREHPFGDGHGRERYFWALVAAILVFLAGAGSRRRPTG